MKHTMKEIKRIECEIIDVDRNNELKQQKKNDAGYNDHSLLPVYTGRLYLRRDGEYIPDS